MTSLFKMEVGSFHALVGVLNKAGLTAELADEIRRNPAMAKRMVAALRVPDDGHPYRGGSQSKSAGVVEYFAPLADADVPAEHQTTLAKYRKLAEEYGVAGSAPLCYRVRTGFTLKQGAPQAGPCLEDFQYLQDWNFADKPTVNSLVFWVPRLVKGGISKTADGQRQLLSDLRQGVELPDYHLANFGEASLVAGLVLAHFKATGERVPLECLWARTDTCHADGDRLNLGRFDENGLNCDRWSWDGARYDDLDVFALGVDHVIRK